LIGRGKGMETVQTIGDNHVYLAALTCGKTWPPFNHNCSLLLSGKDATSLPEQQYKYIHQSTHRNLLAKTDH